MLLASDWIAMKEFQIISLGALNWAVSGGGSRLWRLPNGRLPRVSTTQPRIIVHSKQHDTKLSIDTTASYHHPSTINM